MNERTITKRDNRPHAGPAAPDSASERPSGPDPRTDMGRASFGHLRLSSGVFWRVSNGSRWLALGLIRCLRCQE